MAIKPFYEKLMEKAKICPHCDGLICDRCGTIMNRTYEWSDCTVKHACFRCDRKFYTYYAGKPDYKGGSIQKLWFAIMQRYWREEE